MNKRIIDLLPFGVVNEIENHILTGNDPELLLNFDFVSEHREGNLSNFFNHFVASEKANKHCTLLFTNIHQIVEEIVMAYNDELRKGFTEWKEASEQAVSEIVAVIVDEDDVCVGEHYSVTSIYDYNGEELVALYDEDLDEHFVMYRDEVNFVKVDTLKGIKDKEECEEDELEKAFASLIEALSSQLDEDEQEINEPLISLDEQFALLVDELIEVNRANNNYEGDYELVNLLEEQIVSTINVIFESLDSDEEKIELIEEIKKDIAKAKLQ